MQGGLILNSGAALTVAAGVPVTFPGNVTINQGRHAGRGAQRPGAGRNGPTDVTRQTLTDNGHADLRRR